MIPSLTASCIITRRTATQGRLPQEDRQMLADLDLELVQEGTGASDQ